MNRAFLAVALLSVACSREARGPVSTTDPLAPVPWPGSAGCAAVISYQVPPGHPNERTLSGRSFVYDNALAMLVHLSEGRPSDAKAIGCTLVALQNPDRSIGFSFDFAKPPFVDRAYVRAGVVAWTGYALATYDLVTQTDTFRASARAYADGLLAARFKDGPRAGLIAAGRGRWLDGGTQFEPGYVADYAVTEHQIDAYFLLRALHELYPGGQYGAAAEALGHDLIRAAWVSDEELFSAGVDADGQSEDRALDAGGAWGTLFLLAFGDHERAVRAFAATDRTFGVVVRGLPGYAPYVGVVSDFPERDLSQTFFAEGTAAMGVAYARLHQKYSARGVASVLSELRKRHGGAVPYAFPPSEDFPELPAAAPTAWLRLLERELETSSPFVFAAPRVLP